jgi:hypothetical protein
MKLILWESETLLIELVLRFKHKRSGSIEIKYKTFEPAETDEEVDTASKGGSDE